LIENCKAIVTINSDVGWEALLYGKPVVTLAEPFYSRLGYTIDVDDIAELSVKIKAALDKKPITRQDIYKLVNAAFNSAVDGNYYKKGFDFNTDPENVTNIVNGIIASYNRYFKKS
jgi:capsule polysaccharide export protein KpsC/LpsZ